MPRRSPTSKTARAQERDPEETGTLVEIAREVHLLGAATPEDAAGEHARLLKDYERGHERFPVWTYAPPRPGARTLVTYLEAVRASLERKMGTRLGACGPLYLARFDELCVEARASLAVGTERFAEHVMERYPLTIGRRAADALARTWLAEGAPPEGEAETTTSDARDPRSLLSRMRAEVALRRLPFEVRVSSSLSALAAIGGDTIWVAEGRRLRSEDVKRTVLHEIEGHAIPRARARSHTLPLLALGTAGGGDDQEGYALWLEERRGVSGPRRRQELGARHMAVRAMRDGADFVTVVRSLRARGVPLETSLRAAERAFRGSFGRTPGLGREGVYLEALLRVRARLHAKPADEAVLSSGQIAVSAIDVLRPWVRGS